MWQDLSLGTNIFYPVTLNLELDLFLEHWYSTWQDPYVHTNIFSTVSAGVFIFHMNIPCDKIFLLVLNLLTLTFVIFSKDHNKILNIRASLLHISIPSDTTFVVVSRYLFMWPWPSLELAIIGGICVSKTYRILFFTLECQWKSQLAINLKYWVV